MKVLKVNEILPIIETSTVKKNNERTHIMDIKNTMDHVIEMEDALKGKIGSAVKEHFNRLHIPIVLLFNNFLREYNKTIQSVYDLTKQYENDHAIVRQEFIENDVKNGLEKVENLSEESEKIINSEYMKISDLVSSPMISRNELLLQINLSHEHNEKTITELNKLDQEASKLLKIPSDELKEIAGLVQEVTKWSADGKLFDTSTIKELEKYLENNDDIVKMIEKAVESSIKDEGSTITGELAELFGNLSQLNGISSSGKGVLVTSILLKGKISLIKDGKGNFKIIADPGWKKINGKYSSKLANMIYVALDKSSKVSWGSLSEKLAKYRKTPSHLLRNIIGLKPGTTVQSHLSILDRQHKFLVFSESAAKQYKKFPIDVKATIKEFTTKKGITNIVKKIPYVGIGVSVVTNSGELFNDKNKYKSNWEKGGRAAAGIGMDVGVAGLTTGGAVIGSMICPGPGTIVGGAVGATIGIGASIIMDDKIKKIGEKAGKWAGDKLKEVNEKKNKIVKDIKSTFSKTESFVAGLFK